MFYEDERIAVFIDGSNLYLTARNLGLEIDYRKLKDFFSERGRLLRAFYYTAIADDQDYSPIRPLIDWLDYNGYTVITKPLKEFTDENGRRRVKGNMDVEIAVDMLNLAEHVDHVVLFSGDGDFRRVIESVQRRGVRVTVVSSTVTQPPMIADELRRQADHFLELKALENAFLRPRRPARSADDDRADPEADDRMDDPEDEAADEILEEED